MIRKIRTSHPTSPTIYLKKKKKPKEKKRKKKKKEEEESLITEMEGGNSQNGWNSNKLINFWYFI